MTKILFVCLGNICRSPLAEAIFNHKVTNKGLQHTIYAYSAGTANYHVGEEPDPRTVDVAAKHSIAIDHLGQQFKKKHSKEFDYLIAMDASNKLNMVREIGKEPENLFLMRDFDHLGKGKDVPDPWYGGMEGFEKVFNMLDRSLDNLLNYILKEKGL